MVNEERGEEDTDELEQERNERKAIHGSHGTVQRDETDETVHAEGDDGRRPDPPRLRAVLTSLNLSCKPSTNSSAAALDATDRAGRVTNAARRITVVVFAPRDAFGALAILVDAKSFARRSSPSSFLVPIAPKIKFGPPTVHETFVSLSITSRAPPTPRSRARIPFESYAIQSRFRFSTFNVPARPVRSRRPPPLLPPSSPRFLPRAPSASIPRVPHRRRTSSLSRRALPPIDVDVHVVDAVDPIGAGDARIFHAPGVVVGMVSPLVEW